MNSFDLICFRLTGAYHFRFVRINRIICESRVTQSKNEACDQHVCRRDVKERLYFGFEDVKKVIAFYLRLKKSLIEVINDNCLIYLQSHSKENCAVHIFVSISQAFFNTEITGRSK